MLVGAFDPQFGEVSLCLVPSYPNSVGFAPLD